MRLSDNVDGILNLDSIFWPILFIKFFSETKYRDEFIKGNIYSNTFDYMVQCEKEEGKGRGDAYEGISVLSNVHLKFHPQNSDKVLFEASVGKDGLTSKINGSEKMHMFCTTGVSANWFEITEKSDKQIKCKLSIPTEFEAQMKESFGQYVVVYPAADFINQLEKVVKENNLYVTHDKVKYLDYSVNPSERIQSFRSGNPDFYFQKDIYFAPQEEYRFVFPTLLSEEAEVIKLGSNINYIKDIQTIDDLIKFDGGLVIEAK